MTLAVDPLGAAPFAASTESDPPTWTAQLWVGDHLFVIQNTDVLAEDDPVHVLDGLSLKWSIPENNPWPTQPRPVTCLLRLYTTDVVNLDYVIVGLPMSIVLTDVDGNVFGSFYGRVGEGRAATVYRKNGPVMLYTLRGVDFTVDLAETPVTWPLPLPAASSEDRFDAIKELTDAAGLDVNVPGYHGTAAFEELSAGTAAVADLLDDHLRQVAFDEGDGLQRQIVVPDVVTDPPALHAFYCVPLTRTIDASLLPATFELVEGLLSLVFTDLDADSVVPAGLVDQAVEFTRLKFRAPSRVVVDGPVHAEAVRVGPPVQLSLRTTLTDEAAADDMARLYLPDDDEANGWVPDAFRLYAHRQLDVLVPSWFPDHTEPLTDIYARPVVVHGTADQINLSGRLGVFAGQLAAVELRMNRGRPSVEFSLRRQLPIGIGGEAVTYEWLVDTFPDVTFEDVDPLLTFYEARLGKAT